MSREEQHNEQRKKKLDENNELLLDQIGKENLNSS